MTTLKPKPIKNPFPTPIRPLALQSNRRVLVGFSVFLLILTVVFGFSSHGIWALASLILSSFVLFALVFATRNLSNSVDVIADERERRLRDHAHRIAYWSFAAVIGGIAGVLSGYVSTRALGKPLLIIQNIGKLEFEVLVFVIFTLFLALPVYLIAWLEPEPISNPE